MTLSANLAKLPIQKSEEFEVGNGKNYRPPKRSPIFFSRSANILVRMVPRPSVNSRPFPKTPRTSQKFPGDFSGTSFSVDFKRNPEVPQKFARLPQPKGQPSLSESRHPLTTHKLFLSVHQDGIYPTLSGSHRSTRIASDLASRMLTSQAGPQWESESQAFRIARP